jgi:hypothetical protein
MYKLIHVHNFFVSWQICVMHKTITSLQLIEEVYELNSSFTLSVPIGGRGAVNEDFTFMFVRWT